MLKDMTPRERKYETTYELAFWRERYCGCSFPCDEKGNVFFDKMEYAAKRNYEDALKHPEEYPYCFNEVVKDKWSYIQPATGICKCGHRIELNDEYMGACECPYCGQWYSLSGQELLPPEKWGWDGTPMDDDY